MATKETAVTNRKELGKFTLEISPEAIRSVISSGRLLELADTMATEAAAQISAQIVEKVAEAAVAGGLQSGVGASAAFIFDGGDFGTIPPKPKWGVLNREILNESVLRRVAVSAATAG